MKLQLSQQYINLSKSDCSSMGSWQRGHSVSRSSSVTIGSSFCSTGLGSSNMSRVWSPRSSFRGTSFVWLRLDMSSIYQKWLLYELGLAGKGGRCTHIRTFSIIFTLIHAVISSCLIAWFSNMCKIVLSTAVTLFIPRIVQLQSSPTSAHRT